VTRLGSEGFPDFLRIHWISSNSERASTQDKSISC
jgi:hypothetical protein